MSGRCRSHLYSRAMQHGSRGVCVRCGGHEPVRGIVTDKHTYERPRGGDPQTLTVRVMQPAGGSIIMAVRSDGGPACERRPIEAFHVPQLVSELYPDGYD